MARIAGYFGAQRSPSVIRSMVRKIAHRGGLGEAFHETERVCMGISGGYAASLPGCNCVLVFDGALQNGNALRQHLQERGKPPAQDDMGVVLQMYVEHGVSCLSYFEGAFAFALHDPDKGLVFMARDRFGVRPFYYMTTQSGDFLFASEAKALHEHPDFRLVPDFVAVDAYLTLGHGLPDKTLIKGVHKLTPGRFLIWNDGLHVHEEEWWNLSHAETPDARLKTDADVVGKFDASMQVFLAAASGKKLAVDMDDPVLCAAVTRAEMETPEILTVAFDDPSNTTRAASASVTMHAADIERLPEWVWAMDEPFSDCTLLALPRVMAEASRGNRALACTAGFDVFFGGTDLMQDVQKVRKIPDILKKISRRFMSSRENEILESFQQDDFGRRYIGMRCLFDAGLKNSIMTASMRQVSETFADTIRESSVQKDDPERVIMHMQAKYDLSTRELPMLDRIQAYEGGEVVLPYLDRTVAELLISQPLSRKKLLLQRDGGGIQKTGRLQLAAQIMRQKTMQSFIDILLSEKSMRNRGLFEPDAVRRLIMATRKEGSVQDLRRLFALLTLELWFRINIDDEKGWIS